MAKNRVIEQIIPQKGTNCWIYVGVSHENDLPRVKEIIWKYMGMKTKEHRNCQIDTDCVNPLHENRISRTPPLPISYSKRPENRTF